MRRAAAAPGLRCLFWLCNAIDPRRDAPAIARARDASGFSARGPDLALHAATSSQGHQKERWSHTWYLKILYYFGAVARYG